MKKAIAAAGLGAAVALGSLAGAGTASADYTWVADDSAQICNNLSLQSSVPSTDWVTLAISEEQMIHSIGRAEAVAGIQQAAAGYCPRYLSYVPAR